LQRGPPTRAVRPPTLPGTTVPPASAAGSATGPSSTSIHSAAGSLAPRKTKAQRLEEFYRKTLASASPRAADVMRCEVEAEAEAEPTRTVVNVRFLCSGHV